MEAVNLNGEISDTSSESTDHGEARVLSEGEFDSDHAEEPTYEIGPYLYEPIAPVQEEEAGVSDSDGEGWVWRLNADRLGEWCQCGSCQPMDEASQCRCCQETTTTQAKIAQLQDSTGQLVKCITDHPGMEPLCFNQFVLEVAWLGYKQHYGGNAFSGRKDERYRHIAYRQFVRWCWGFLGKEVRVVLPACVVCCIRAHFPPPGREELYTFRGFRMQKINMPALE